MSITIKAWNESDFESIFQLIKEFATFQKTPGKVTITPQEMIADKGLFKCFVAEDASKQIAGFASYFFVYYSWSGKAIYVVDLFVAEKFRVQRIGTQLLQKVIEHARRENCKKDRCKVSNWNKPAIEFYKKIGAEIDEVEINCDLQLS